MLKTVNLAVGVFSAMMLMTAAMDAHALTLRASHQFPGGVGDVRDEMLQLMREQTSEIGRLDTTLMLILTQLQKMTALMERAEQRRLQSPD